MLGAMTGAAGGGILGQIGDVLSAPRRALWGAVGLPGSGEDLVSNLGLAEKGSMLARGLGMGAEMLGDPLTYLGAGLGGLGGEAVGGLLEGSGEAAAAGREIDALNSARRAAQEGLVEQAGLGERTVAEQRNRFADMAGRVDPDSLAEADYKSYKAASPEAAAALEKSGLGTGTHEGGATIYGSRKPVGVEVKALGAGGGDKALKGRGLARDLDQSMGGDLSPYERYLLMNEGQAARSSGLPIASIHNPADPLVDVAMRRAAEINGARQVPTVAEQMLSNFMPHAHIDAVKAMGLGELPIGEGFDRAQSMLAKALQSHKAARAGQLGVKDYALIGAAGGAAGGAGGALAKSSNE